MLKLPAKVTSLKVKIVSMFHSIATSAMCLGNNHRIKYYVIRRDWRGCGFFSNWMYVASHSLYAQCLNLIPVVDMEHYPTHYDNHILSKNIWEYYFELNHTLAECKLFRNCIYSTFVAHPVPRPFKLINDKSISHDLELLYKYHLFASYNLIPNQIIQNIIDCTLTKFSNRVLGVHYRGSDKKSIDLNKYPDHLQTSPKSEYINQISRITLEYSLKTVFIATDDSLFIIELESIFPHLNIIYTESLRTSNSIGLHNQRHLVEDPAIASQLAIDVIVDTYCLAKCEYLLHGNSNVIDAAKIISNASHIYSYEV